jgi:sterol desaturase/sphingolipid hydroxylase (fatty acid hydroxylase superfamily)
VSEWLLAHEPQLRLGVFLGLFALLALAQWRWPLRGVEKAALRFGRHLLIAALGTLLVRLAAPVAAVGAGALAWNKGIGLLPVLDVPMALAIPLSIVLLDLAIYWQHRVFHHVPLLWRLHRMHHADTAFEVSTAIRFHPLEILLSMWIKVVVVLLLGAPAVAVLLFEILLNATALFSHADLRLPEALDRRLRRLLVTPDMHRVHHSVERHETNSNYGFCLSIWDRLFGSYRERPRAEQQRMPIGLEYFRAAADSRVPALLVQPFGAP